MSANISLIGNLGKEPETRISENGTLVASFSIASNSFKNSAEGKVQKTDWFRVIAFGKQAETLARFVRKGSRLCVQGRLTFNPWLDRKGNPQVGADIILNEFEFLPGGRRDDGSASAEADDYIAGQAPAPVQAVQEVTQQTAAY